MKKKIYHGSNKIIEKPIFGFGKASSGLEYPKKTGQTVLIRKDKLKVLCDLYNNELEMKSFAIPINDK